MFRSFKYILPLTLYGTAWISFTHEGWYCWLPLIYAFLLIPFMELILKPNAKNLTETERDLARSNKLYDWMLYLLLPVQYLALFFFLNSMQNASMNSMSIAGRICSMGLLCGTFGINVAHELGHRLHAIERMMAKALLTTSLYMHFYIEHNKGHHKHVATPEDPSSARLNEPIYFFWPRTLIFSYLSAWKIANKTCQQKDKKGFSIFNEMIQAHLIQGVFVFLIYYLFGFKILVWFLLSALMGMLLLETVNYIEHYGLSRKKTVSGAYERAMPIHSWNSNHPMGRIMLFELSRHSDHHYLAHKKYQLLDHHDDAPQLPTGYPGSMILSLLPPLWFRVMNKRIQAINKLKSTS